MSKKGKVAFIIIAGFIFIGFAVHDIITGDIGYFFFKAIGATAVVGYMLYNYFSKKRESHF
ncbi:hypothetical protein [Guptibacillus algicola]|uniref:hypothetical protein n=1 Tax=Guptibacillus algicola TaxID=225844 RepID=UPI001CD71075|nr:hypothetical protein [Alkalihalobacillus algicola]MCA0987189.1 hypothetical protein [Alkalihalobacillus algicola]